MDCAALVAEHLRLRQHHNPRYSLRALARDLGVSHSTLSGVVGRRRPASAAFARRVGEHLGVTGPALDELVGREHERRLAAHVARPGFRPDLRDVAVRSGLSLDALCVALHRLLTDRRLELTAPTTWTLTEAP